MPRPVVIDLTVVKVIDLTEENSRSQPIVVSDDDDIVELPTPIRTSASKNTPVAYESGPPSEIRIGPPKKKRPLPQPTASPSKRKKQTPVPENSRKRSRQEERGSSALPGSKRQRTDEPLTDSEEEYERTWPHLTASLPEPEHISDSKDDESEVEEIRIPLPPKPRPHRISRMRPVERSSPPPPQDHVWDLLQEFVRQHPKSFRHTRQMNTPRKATYMASRLHCVDSFKESPGAIVKIVQKDGLVAVGSATPAGLPDYPNEEPDNYNKEGTLVMYKSAPLVLPGHHRFKRRHGSVKDDDPRFRNVLYRDPHYSQLPPPQQAVALRDFRRILEENLRYHKHYSVHDLAFLPPDEDGDLLLASTGNDKYLRFWDVVSSDEQHKSRRPSIPHMLAVCPESSILAVGETDIAILRDFDSGLQTLKSVAGNRADHQIGSILWGQQSTTNQLFASTEPSDADGNIENGFHMVFDIETRKLMYQLNATETGDNLGLHPNGEQLALITEDSTKNILRIYDVARQSGKAIHSVQLPAFYADPHKRLLTSITSYSPDGLYLAIARNDNHTHVYDSRMLSRGVLYDFVHSGPCKVSPGAQRYGIVHAEWIETRSQRLRLVTGGEDGCVRLWDPLIDPKSRNNGTVIAEANADIGYFSIGNKFQGEHDLVVGDCDGWVHIYDAKSPFFLTCDA